MEVETVSEAFAEFLQNQGIAIFNQDLFLNQVPDTAPDALYWLVTSGGLPLLTLYSGEKVKQYFISLYYRSTKEKDVEKNLFRLEEMLNNPACVELTGFNVYNIEASQFASDVDMDNQERRVGMVQVNIKVYKNL